MRIVDRRNLADQLVAWGLGLLAFATAATAQQPVVGVSAGGSLTLPPVYSQDTSDGSWDIDIYVDALTDVTLTITGAPGFQTRLDQIRIEPNVGGDVNVVIESTLGNRIVELREVFFTDLPGGVSTIDGNLVLGTIDIDKTTAGTLGTLGIVGGSFDAAFISVLRIEGDILSDLNSASATRAVNRIECGGSLLGDVDFAGDCRGILVGFQQGGGTSNIGTSISNLTINVNGDLDSLIGDNIYANVTIGGNFRICLAEGSLNTVGTPPGDGVFSGSLSCKTISGGTPEVSFTLYGDLDADITIRDELAIDKRMGIGGNITSNGSITFTQADGLKGDITIGYLPAISADWLGDITLGNTTLSPKPFYTQTPTAGGQVGTAPHGLHREACDPAYAPDYPVEPAGTLDIDLVHYGKIQLAPSPTGIPYKVLEAAGSHCDGTCIHALLTDVTAGDPGPPVRAPWTLVNVLGRTATINGPIFAGKHYHIVLNDDDPSSPVQHLETADLFGSQNDIPSYLYVIGTQ